jgi:hypothetical protein
MPARETGLATNPSPPHAFAAGTIFTVGHSTRPIASFIALLEAYGIRQLVDIRTIPRSRHNPQFNAEALAEALSERGIRYVSCPALGGLRHARRDSPNDGWRNESFRGYADYMQTDAFGDALTTLIAVSRSQPTAIMCAGPCRGDATDRWWRTPFSCAGLRLSTSCPKATGDLTS